MTHTETISAKSISAESLSSCKACYCMTKTINSKCSKCWTEKPVTIVTEYVDVTNKTTPPTVSVEDWEQRFDEKFPLNGEVWVLERHRDAVKQHHLEAIDLARGKKLED